MNDTKPAINETAKKVLNFIEGHEALFPQQLATHFPSILEKMVVLWPQPEQERHYFQELLVTQRENRQGFPAEIYTEIFALSEFYEHSFPPAKNTKDDFWTWVKQ